MKVSGIFDSISNPLQTTCYAPKWCPFMSVVLIACASSWCLMPMPSIVFLL